VGSYPITAAMVQRVMRVEQASEPSPEQLVPPAFAACVTHLRAEATTNGISAPNGSQLRGECQTRYLETLHTAASRLIWDEWLIDGARELGVPVSSSAVSSSLETAARLASTAIHTAIDERVTPITPAQIASYYAQHRFDYLTTSKRDIKIVRTTSSASAAKARAELEAGESFATVEKQQPVHQPLDSSEGLVLNLTPHFYGEPNLNQAIFTTRPGILIGPVYTWAGDFVAEVARVVAEHEKPLAQVRASIRELLERPLQERALAAFESRWRATWAAHTNCSPEYVMPDCRQYNGPPAAKLEAPPGLG
jgi:hypothetical protein